MPSIGLGPPEGVKGLWSLYPPTEVGARGGSSERKSEPSPLSDQAVPAVHGEGGRQGPPPRSGPCSGPPTQAGLHRGLSQGARWPGGWWERAAEPSYSLLGVGEGGGAHATLQRRVRGRQGQMEADPRDCGREGPGGDFKAQPEQPINKPGWRGSQRGPFWRGWKLARVV